MEAVLKPCICGLHRKVLTRMFPIVIGITLIMLACYLAANKARNADAEFDDVAEQDTRENTGDCDSPRSGHGHGHRALLKRKLSEGDISSLGGYRRSPLGVHRNQSVQDRGNWSQIHLWIVQYADKVM